MSAQVSLHNSRPICVQTQGQTHVYTDWGGRRGGGSVGYRKLQGQNVYTVYKSSVELLDEVARTLANPQHDEFQSRPIHAIRSQGVEKDNGARISPKHLQ